MANAAAPRQKTTRLAAVTGRLRKIRSGTSGAVARRASISTKVASSARPSASVDQRARRAPAVGVGLDDAVGQHDQAGGHRERAGEVEERAAPTSRRRTGDDAQPGERRDDPDRHVDQQDPAPRQRLGQDPAEQRAGRAADAAHRAPEPERAVALAALGEGRRQDRERRRSDDRAAEPLHRPRGDQLASVCASPPNSDANANSSRPPAKTSRRPIRSAARPPSSRKPANVKRVGVDDPLQARRR